MVRQTLLKWSPDLRLPVRSTLQEFLSHDRELTLRISLKSGQEAQVEVNDRVVAETQGFPKAAALAELYTRKHEILLTDESVKIGKKPGRLNYYRIRVGSGEYELCEGKDPVALVDEPQSFCPIPRCHNLPEAIQAAVAQVGKTLTAAFMDQAEICRGLGQCDANGLMVAVWCSRWQTAFVPILHEVEESSPLYLDVSRSFDGAYFTIYELVNRNYLAEIRSHDMAEQIGTFASVESARAFCHLVNAARHSSEWISFSGVAPEMKSLDGVYLLKHETDGLTLLADKLQQQALGHFTSRRIAEAYATVHRDAMEHFIPRAD